MNHTSAITITNSPMDNALWKIADGSRIALRLAPCEYRVYCWPKENMEAEEAIPDRAISHAQVLKKGFYVSFAAQEDYPVFSDEIVLKELVPLQERRSKEDFAGVIRYETESVRHKPLT